MSGRHARPVPRDLPATTADDARATVDALDAKAEAEMDGAAESGKAEAADRSQETPAPEPPD